MAGNPNFGNLYSTSTDNYLPKLKDNYTSMSRLLDFLKKAGNIRTEDAKFIIFVGDRPAGGVVLCTTGVGKSRVTSN